VPRLIALVSIFIAFNIYSFWVDKEQGYWGFLPLIGREAWGLQIFLDLGIALAIAWGGLRRDAKIVGINPWPYMIGTLFLGSIAPLAYLIHRQIKKMKGKELTAN